MLELFLSSSGFAVYVCDLLSVKDLACVLVFLMIMLAFARVMTMKKGKECCHLSSGRCYSQADRS